MSAFKFKVDNDGIARLVFDIPGEKVNTFSMPVIEELETILDEAAQNKAIKAMTISSGKENVFIAGADLHSFEPMFKDPAQAEKIIAAGQRVFNKLQYLPFPTVALIQGACLGGGLEFALACTYRVVSDHPKTMLGLPEVTLGIIPGWGGTQRLPRLVGLLEGLPMILGGKPVKAKQAWKIKLADAICAAEFFDAKANEFVKEILTPAGKQRVLKRRKPGGWKHYLLEANPLGRKLIFYRAEKDVLSKTKGHYPAPLIALKLIEETCTLPLQQGLTKEAQAFSSNASTGFANAQNLIHLFFVQEALKKETFIAGNPQPAKLSAAGVIGAGTMGSGIAWLFSYKDIPVRMKDIDWTAVGKGYGAAFAIYNKMIKDKKLRANEASLKFHRISGTTDYSGFENANLVVEAAVESLELKHQILQELENVLPPDAVIGSNTSSLTISEIGTALKNPGRLVGMHFFNPASRMPLVEIVASEKTTPTAIATAVDASRKLGKTPVVVRDCPGFLVNRILVTSLNEIIRMYEEGQEMQKLELMMSQFGMPMSPFVLADEVGNDVSYKVGKAFEQAYGPRMALPKLLSAMYEQQLFGKKNGKGFFVYKGQEKKPNHEVEKLRNGFKNGSKPLSEEEMRDRAMLPMINEAARCLQEKVIDKPAYLDMALILGIGFPPFRGGLLRYADSLGIEYVVSQLKRLEQQHGERFKPCELLVTMQAGGKKFFPG